MMMNGKKAVSSDGASSFVEGSSSKNNFRNRSSAAAVTGFLAAPSFPSLKRLGDEDLLRQLHHSIIGKHALVSDEQRVGSNGDISTATTSSTSTFESESSSDPSSLSSLLSSSSSSQSHQSRRNIFPQYWKQSTASAAGTTPNHAARTSGSSSSSSTQPGAGQIRAPRSPLVQHYGSSPPSSPSCYCSQSAANDNSNDGEGITTRTSTSRRRRSIFGPIQRRQYEQQEQEHEQNNASSYLNPSSRESSLESIESINSFQELFATKRSQDAHKHITVISSTTSDSIQPFGTSSLTRQQQTRRSSWNGLDPSIDPLSLRPRPAPRKILHSCLKRRSSSSSTFASSSSTNSSMDASDNGREDRATKSSNNAGVDEAAATATTQHNHSTTAADTNTNDDDNEQQYHDSNHNNLSVRFDSRIEVVAFEQEEEEESESTSSPIKSFICRQVDKQFKSSDSWTDYFSDNSTHR